MFAFLRTIASWVATKIIGGEAVIAEVWKTADPRAIFFVILGILPGCIAVWGTEGQVRYALENRWWRRLRHSWLYDDSGFGFFVKYMVLVCILFLVFGVGASLVYQPGLVGSTTALGAALYTLVFGTIESMPFFRRLGSRTLNWLGRQTATFSAWRNERRNRIEKEQAERRLLAGDEIAAQFERVRVRLVEVMSGSRMFEDTKERVNTFVERDLVSELEKRRRLLIGLPLARRALEEAAGMKDAPPEKVMKGRRDVARSQRRLVKIEAELRSLLASLTLEIPAIVDTITSCSGETEVPRRTITMISDCVQALQDAAHETEASDAAETELPLSDASPPAEADATSQRIADVISIKRPVP